MAERATTVQSVHRAIALLRAVAEASARRRLSVTEAAAAVGLNRATAWRLLVTLQQEGLVTVDRDGRYGIGYTAVEIAGAADLSALIRSASGALTELSRQTGETAALAIAEADAPRYVDETSPGTSVVSASWLGRNVAWHATSTGKAILAFSTHQFTERILKRGLERFTENTVTDPDQLRAELAAVREHGYAVCRGELDVDAWGVSAPIFDSQQRTIAVISIWGPGARITEERFPALGRLVRQAASSLRPGDPMGPRAS